MEIEIIDNKKIIITLDNESDQLNAQQIVDYARYLQTPSDLQTMQKVDNTDADDDDIEWYNNLKEWYDNRQNNPDAIEDEDDDDDDDWRDKLHPDTKNLLEMIENLTPLPDFDYRDEYGDYLLQKYS
jgi:hypothetical protein